MSESRKTRVAVVGVGDFGRHHVRIYRELDAAELIGVFDTDAARARAVAAEFGTVAWPELDSLVGRAEAASVAVPTTAHARIGCWLLERGVDVLVEKPMAASLAEADALIEAARRHDRILQVGHLERFNPAVVAAQRIVRRPLFFEVHRLGVFTPRSLDVDVIYDVMIHDLDILLTLAGAEVAEVRAVGIPILTDKVDIAHARIEFASGAVANLTASRVSTERVRKLRFFQEHEYISIDYTRQDVLRVRLAPAASTDTAPQFQFEKLPTEPEEPLRAELRAFLQAVQTRCPAPVDGLAGRRALELADRVMRGIQEHARRVQPGSLTPPAHR